MITPRSPLHYSRLLTIYASPLISLDEPAETYTIPISDNSLHTDAKATKSRCPWRRSTTGKNGRASEDAPRTVQRTHTVYITRVGDHIRKQPCACSADEYRLYDFSTDPHTIPPAASGRHVIRAYDRAPRRPRQTNPQTNKTEAHKTFREHLHTSCTANAALPSLRAASPPMVSSAGHR